MIVMISSSIEIDECVPDCCEERSGVVLDAMFSKQGLHSHGSFRVVVLGHRWEQVMLNLEVEVSHPPIADGASIAVHGMLSRILDP